MLVSSKAKIMGYGTLVSLEWYIEWSESIQGQVRVDSGSSQGQVRVKSGQN
jgi:hypothetical protein